MRLGWESLGGMSPVLRLPWHCYPVQFVTVLIASQTDEIVLRPLASCLVHMLIGEAWYVDGWAKGRRGPVHDSGMTPMYPRPALSREAYKEMSDEVLDRVLLPLAEHSAELHYTVLDMFERMPGALPQSRVEDHILLLASRGALPPPKAAEETGDAPAAAEPAAKRAKQAAEANTVHTAFAALTRTRGSGFRAHLHLVLAKRREAGGAALDSVPAAPEEAIAE